MDCVIPFDLKCLILSNCQALAAQKTATCSSSWSEALDAVVDVEMAPLKKSRSDLLELLLLAFGLESSDSEQHRCPPGCAGFWRRCWFSWRSQICVRCCRPGTCVPFAPFLPMIMACARCTNDRSSWLSLITGVQARKWYHLRHQMIVTKLTVRPKSSWNRTKMGPASTHHWEAQVKQCALDHYGGEVKFAETVREAIEKPLRIASLKANLRQLLNCRLDREIRMGRIDPEVLSMVDAESMCRAFWDHRKLVTTNDRQSHRELDGMMQRFSNWTVRKRALRHAFIRHPPDFLFLLDQKIAQSLMSWCTLMHSLQQLDPWRGLMAQNWWRSPHVIRTRISIQQFVCMGTASLDIHSVPLNLMQDIEMEINTQLHLAAGHPVTLHLGSFPSAIPLPLHSPPRFPSLLPLPHFAAQSSSSSSSSSSSATAASSTAGQFVTPILTRTVPSI